MRVALDLGCWHFYITSRNILTLCLQSLICFMHTYGMPYQQMVPSVACRCGRAGEGKQFASRLYRVLRGGAQAC